MAGAVSNLMVRAGFDGAQLTRGLQQMQGEVKGAHSSIASSLGTIGKVAGAAVLAAGAALTTMGGIIAKVGVQYDMAQENSKIAWTTLLGSSEKAKTMLTDIANFAKNTQFDSEGVDAMAKYMHNAGYEGKALFDQLTKVADVSGAFNITADNAKEMVRQMSQVDQAQVAYTEDLNILQDQGVPIFKAIAKELGVNVGAVKKMASEGKITSKIYDTAFSDIAKSVKGASAAQSQTMSGMLSTLKDDFSIVAGVLAKPMFEKLHDGLKKLMPLMDGLTSLARGDLKSFSSSLNTTFGASAGNAILNFVSTFKDGFGRIKEGIKGVFAILKGNEGGGISMLSRIGLSHEAIAGVDGVVSKIRTAILTVKGAFSILTGDSMGGITFLTKMGFSTETITKIVHVVNGIKNTISSFVTSYIGYIKGLFSGDGNLGQSFSKIFNTAKSIVMPLLTDIIAFIRDKIAMIKQFWDENGAQITQAVKNAWAVIAAIFKFIAPVILFVLKMLWDSVKGLIDGALKVIMGLIKVFSGLFTGDFGKMWEGIKEIFFGAIEAVWNWLNLLMFGRILGGIKAFIVKGGEFFAKFGEKAFEIFKNLDTTIFNVVKGMISKVLGFFKNLYSEGARIFDTLKTFGARTFEALWTAIKTVAKGIADSVVNNFKSLVTGAKHIIEGWIGSVKTNFNAIKNAIVDPIGTAKKLATGIFDKIVEAAGNIPNGIVKGLKSGVKAIKDGIVGLATGLVNEFKKALGIKSPSKVFESLGGHIISGLSNGLTSGNLLDLGTTVFKDFGGGVMNSVSKIKGFLSGLFSGGGGGNVTGWIQQAMALTGAPSSWLGPLSTLVKKESGGNPNAINLWDSNAKAGHPSKGLFQTIDSTFNAYAMKGLGGIYNPIANAVAGIRYIMSRYGSVFNVPGIKSMMSGGKYKGYAIGTGYSPAGWAWTGENGPELAYLPRGSQIKSNTTTKNLLGDGLADVISGAVANAMLQVMQSNNKSNVNGDIVLNLDGRTFARVVKPWLDKENKRVGANVRLQSI
jgi:tape measure domain-containing protein